MSKFIASYFLDGFATAAEQLAGRAVGARYAQGFRRTVGLTAIWGFATSGATALLFLLLGEPLIALVTTAPDVRIEAARYVPWAAFTAVSGVLAFQMDGIYIGATWTRAMRNMMLVAFAAFVAALLTLPPAFGNHGLWAAMHVFLLARGLSLSAALPARARATFP